MTDRQVIVDMIARYHAVEKAYLSAFLPHANPEKCRNELTQSLSRMSILVHSISKEYVIRQGELIHCTQTDQEEQ